jgi:hypothetical protein
MGPIGGFLSKSVCKKGSSQGPLDPPPMAGGKGTTSAHPRSVPGTHEPTGEDMMSIFGNILSKIFHHGQQAAPQPSSTPPSAAASAPAAQSAPAAPQASSTAPAQQPAAPSEPVDVEAVLSELAEAHGGGGNWRSSIVDLLKLLDLDSSLDARKELANELNVHVGGDGSAEENIALHRAVMNKLEENGGHVPDSLKN